MNKILNLYKKLLNTNLFVKHRFPDFENRKYLYEYNLFKKNIKDLMLGKFISPEKRMKKYEKNLDKFSTFQIKAKYQPKK